MIDGLIVIPYNKQIICRCSQHLQYFILKTVNILKLIHQNVNKLFLPGFQNIRSLGKKFITTEDHIIKIQLPPGAESILISILFDGATLIKDYVSEDYLVMSSYAAMFGGVDANGLPHLASANSPLADYPGYLLNYEDPYGAGRIQMIW